MRYPLRPQQLPTARKGPQQPQMPRCPCWSFLRSLYDHGPQSSLAVAAECLDHSLVSLKSPTSRTLPRNSSSAPGYCFDSVVFTSVYLEHCRVSVAWWEPCLCVFTQPHGYTHPLFSAGPAQASQRTTTCRRGLEGSVL